MLLAMGVMITPVLIFHEVVFANDMDYQQAVSLLRNLRNEDGVPPDIQDFLQFISKQCVQLSYDEQMSLYVELLNMQRPEIALTKVVSLAQAKQNSIRDIFCKYTVSKAGFDTTSAREFSVINDFTYAYDEGKRHFDETLAGNETTSRRSYSYDGEREYFLQYPKGKELTPYAEIGNLSADNWFFPRELPMLQSMLFDTSRSSHPQRSLDICLMLNAPGVYVYQKRTEIEGVKCLLVADMARRVYLDLERNFCVLMYEEYDIDFGGNGNIVGASLTSRRVLGGLKDYGNSLWLPSKIENSFFENEQRIWGETITVEELAINKGVEVTYFTGRFPESTLVFDREANFSYLQSTSPSINALLKETAKSKRVWFWQITSMTLGIILILIWIIIKYVKYRAYLASK